jgi:hypothetical protein
MMKAPFLGSDVVAEASAMYSAGDSIRSLASHFGCSREAMRTALKRHGVQMRNQFRFGAENHFYRGGYRQVRRSQKLVQYAVANGSLAPQPCESCGATGYLSNGRRRVDAHHDDYTQPLNVRWLCQPCHHAWHKAHIAKV